MEEIKDLLNERKEELLKMKKEKERALKSAPEGSLRISTHGNRIQYYQRKEPKDFNGVYIREKEIELAKKLAQKEYDKKILCAVEKELKAIEKYCLSYPKKTAESVYEKLHKERQKLITPLVEPDEQYIQQWEQVNYRGKDFLEGTPEFYTAKGERVRSKSEVMIADLLNREGIPYRYEYPIHFKGKGMVYPDFTALNTRTRKEWYWEHLGMMDDTAYLEAALQKIAAYEQNGIFPGEKLILTYETRKNPMNQKLVLLIIQHYLK